MDVDKCVASWEDTSNGSTGAVISMPGSGIVRLDFFFKVGVLTEDADTLAYAHLLEHCMASYPSRTHPVPHQNQEALGCRGIRCNASTFPHLTRYWAEGPAEFAEFLLDLLFQNLIDPCWVDEKFFESEKQAAEHEIKNVLNQPWRTLTDKMHQVLYPGTALAYSIPDQLKNLQTATNSAIMAFRTRHYTPANLTAVLTGDVDDGIVSTFHRSLSEFQNVTAARNMAPPLWSPNRCPFSSPFVFVPPAGNVEGYRLLFVFRIPFIYFSEKRFALYSLRQILVGGMSSRLYRLIRTNSASKAYNIAVHIETDPQSVFLSTLTIKTTTTSNHFHDVVQVVLDELAKVQEEITSKEEVMLENSNTLTAALQQLNGTPDTFVNAYSPFLIWDEELKTREWQIQQRKKVSAEDIRAVAKEVFSSLDHFTLFYSGAEALHYPSGQNDPFNIV